MKILKNYFLFFAQHPIGYNVSLWIFVFLVSFVLSSYHIINIPGYYLGIEIIIFVVHTVVIYQVILSNITRQAVDVLNDYSYLFQVAVFPDGRKEILSKPIWGKSNVYSVAKMLEYSGRGEMFIVKTSCGGKYENSHITIPVNLKFRLSGSFNQLELFNELFKEQNDPYGPALSIEKYVRSVFKKVNVKSQDLIDAAIKKYAQLQSSEPVLLNEVIAAINFPDRLLSNIIDVKICLESPIYSSCKGMSCGEEM